jgi:hypothetical protein
MLKYRFTEWKMTYVRGKQKWIQVISNVADPDPGSGHLLTPGSEMGKKSRSGSGMNIPDHISESLGTIFWVKNTQKIL